MFRRFATSVTVVCFCGLLAHAQGLNTQASKDDWEEINFEFNSAVLSDGYPSLLRLADLLSKHTGYHVRVEGNTDNIGGSGYNEKLGLERANTVRDFLVKYGAKPDQVEVASRGKTNPEVHGFKRNYSKTDVARWMNRRVVLTVTDEQGRTVSAGGAAEAIKAMEPAAAEGPSQCCTDILKRLDDIAKMLQDMSAQNTNLKQQVADLQKREGDLENQINGAPKPMTEQQTANVVDQRLEQFRDKKFSLLGINVGEDSYNHDLTLSWKGRYFSPFKDHFAFQAQGEYDYFDQWHEGEFDFGLVDRISQFQAGAFASFKHVDLKGMTDGATLGQASVTWDYIFNRGKIGFFGTKAFLDNQLVNSTNATFTGPGGALMTAPNLFVDSYLHVVDQVGADATIGLWGRNYFELNGGYLRSLQHGDHGGGTARFVFPIANRLAITLEGSINPTYLASSTWGEVLAGVQWGNFERPKEYMASDKPVPVDVPQIRWEVATRIAQRGVSPPIANAGPNQIGVPAGTITLNGSASYDPNGLALSYQWTQVQGPPVSLSGANAAIATFQATASSSYAFTLTVKNTQNLSASANVRVTTQAPPAGATVSFCTASPMTVTLGQSTSIIYNTQNATSVTITPSVGATPGLNGSVAVTPTQTTTYVITATGSGGSSSTCSVGVTVAPQPAPQILVFSANPSTINAGGSSTLAWAVTNATSVSISGGVGTVGTSGSQSVSPAQTTTYTLTATNQSSSTTASATVTVNQPPPVPVITSFTANPPTINAGGSSVLTCLATGATSVSIQGIAPVNASGSFTVTPTTTTTYTCIATNAQGSSTKQATVTVNQPTGPGGGSGGPVISVPGGPVIYTQVSAVQLDLTGTKSPTNSYPITYSTVATSGGVSVANGATAMPTITVPAINGTYTVRITATDSNKVSSTYNLTVIFVGGQIYPTGKGLPRGSSRQ